MSKILKISENVNAQFKSKIFPLMALLSPQMQFKALDSEEKLTMDNHQLINIQLVDFPLHMISRNKIIKFVLNA